MKVLRRRVVPALDPGADPACRLRPEEGRRRAPDLERLFSHLGEQRQIAGGNEFLFRGDVEDLWREVSLFVDEESACCPFFTYEQLEEPNGVVLRVTATPATVQSDG